MAQLATPDGRYIIVRGRLWRRANPLLLDEDRERFVHELMSARRAKKSALSAGDHDAVIAAKTRVQAAKEGLGERGPAWWLDGAPDENRKLARNSSYAAWYASMEEDMQPDRG